MRGDGGGGRVEGSEGVRGVGGCGQRVRRVVGGLGG